MSNFQQKSQPPDPNHSFTTFDIAQTKSSSERCVRQKNNFDTSVETSNMTEYNGQCSSSSAFQETNDYYPSFSEKEGDEKKKKGLSAEQEERLERQRIIDENAVDLIKVILQENPHFSNYSDKALIARTGWSKTKIGNFIRAIRKGIRIFQHTKAATQTSKSPAHRTPNKHSGKLKEIWICLATIAWFFEKRVLIMRRYVEGMLPTLPFPMNILEKAYNKYPFIESQKQIAELYLLTGLLETFVIQFFKERRMIDSETSGNAVLNKHDKKNSSK
ncbi:hypothetical protein L3Y34_013126 [Caenorhabditis briggsae]|uniref:Uncharacterized protein n=1 Tax=Caenorhabditis briggsae TaxID=6238 RepID=A0AAE9CWP5_CAEBR|nr:hypothetical protein L3Y34_013126 [Caenorhabditis briggsae]